MRALRSGPVDGRNLALPARSYAPLARPLIAVLTPLFSGSSFVVALPACQHCVGEERREPVEVWGTSRERSKPTVTVPVVGDRRSASGYELGVTLLGPCGEHGVFLSLGLRGAVGRPSSSAAGWTGRWRVLTVFVFADDALTAI
jgi:hypothetical protein